MEERERQRRGHRLVQVHDVEPFAAQQPADVRLEPHGERDAGDRAAAGNGNGPPHRDEPRLQLALPGVRERADDGDGVPLRPQLSGEVVHVVVHASRRTEVVRRNERYLQRRPLLLSRQHGVGWRGCLDHDARTPSVPPGQTPSICRSAARGTLVVPAKAGTSPGVGASLVGALSPTSPEGEVDALAAAGEGPRRGAGVGPVSPLLRERSTRCAAGEGPRGESLGAPCPPPLPRGEVDALARRVRVTPLAAS